MTEDLSLGKYRKALNKLVEHHSQMTNPSFNPFEKHDRALNIVQNMLAIGELLGVPPSASKAEAVKEVLKETGLDFGRLLSPLPEADPVPDLLMTPDELAEYFGIKHRMYVNCALTGANLQKKVAGRWEPTLKGFNMCKWRGKLLAWKVESVRHILETEVKK